jgi:hypothetical protein
MLRTREQAISYLVAASVGSVLIFVGTIVVLTILLGSPLIYSLVRATLLGGMLALAALLYWLSIRWMDTHNRW